MFHDPVSSQESVCGTENFHGLATFRAEVSTTPFPPHTVLTVCCFPLLNYQTLDQNLLTTQELFPVTSPNSTSYYLYLDVDLCHPLWDYHSESPRREPENTEKQLASSH